MDRENQRIFKQKYVDVDRITRNIAFSYKMLSTTWCENFNSVLAAVTILALKWLR